MTQAHGSLDRRNASLSFQATKHHASIHAASNIKTALFRISDKLYKFYSLLLTIYNIDFVSVFVLTSPSKAGVQLYRIAIGLLERSLS